MHYITIIICCSFLALCFLVMRNVSRFKKTHRQSHTDFMERESEANAVRKADISNLPYIEIPLATLPLDCLDAAGHPELRAKLCTLASTKILNLSMYTNTELKLMYGPANLEPLSACDDAFTELIRLLDRIGATLLAAAPGNTGDAVSAAERFLSYAVSIGSDITTSYTMLAGIYADNQDIRHLDALIHTSETITSLSGKAIQSKLHSIKSGLK